MGRFAISGVILLGLAACDPSGFGQGTGALSPEVVFPQDPSPDSNGVVQFRQFRVVIARDGDTLTGIAERVDMQPSLLARYNGLPLDYLLRPGERVALPGDQTVLPGGDTWSPADAATAIEAPETESDLPPRNRAQVMRHVVGPNDSAASIARLYGVSVTALASWNGLDRELSVEPGRSLIIPPRAATSSPGGRSSGDAETVETTTLAPADADAAARQPEPKPGRGTAVPLPPSADKPLPEDLPPPPTETVRGPDLSAEAEQALPVTARFRHPVSGKVVKGYAPTGRNRNEGLDYQTAPNAPVAAAGDGEVALVSRSLGGLGTIVLVRHADDLMTVYGRVSDVNVKKGDRVSRGQTIGRVADGTPPIFHFEIRRGTESVDPVPFL